VEQKITWRRGRGTRNAMQGRTLNREWGSKRKAWNRKCHGGRNVEQEITWSEWRRSRNDM
jgi:hypothetical protein